MTKKILLTLFILLITLTLIISAIPKAMQFGAIYLLDKEGVQAEIHDINIDMFNGEFEIIQAQGTNANGNGFNIGHLLIDFYWPSIFDHSVIINGIKLDNFKLDTVHADQNILSIGGINLAGQNKEEITPPAEEELDDERDTPWNILLKNVSLNNISTCNTFESKKICSQLKSLNWTGEINLSTESPIEENINIESTLSINNVSITDIKNDIPIFTNRSIDLNKFTLKGINDLSFESFIVKGLKAFPEKDDSLSIAVLDNFEINQLKLSNNKTLHIKNIILAGTGANIVIDKNKSLNIQQRLSSSLPIKNNDSPENKDEAKPTTEPLNIKIDEIRIEDGHLLTFTDQSLNTPFKTTSTINHISITNFDTENKKTKNHLKIDLTAREHGKIELEGDVQLLSKLKAFDISGNAKGIDLRPISSYLEPAIGHKVKSGQLNADIKLSASNGTIDSLLDLNLKKFELRPISEKEKAKLDKDLGLGMPLNSALNLLRDGDDNINIELPITGDVENPDFDPSDAIFTAMSKAITSAIVNYYTPFGLVTVAGGLFDLATALRFEPVIFNANESEILSPHETGLNKVVELMKQRPALHLTLCGFSNIEDLSVLSPDTYSKIKDLPEKPALSEKLLPALSDIASKRSENIKTYFVKNGTAADRLILCEPEYNHSAIAGVEISL